MSTVTIKNADGSIATKEVSHEFMVMFMDMCVELLEEQCAFDEMEAVERIFNAVDVTNYDDVEASFKIVKAMTDQVMKPQTIQ